MVFQMILEIYRKNNDFTPEKSHFGLALSVIANLLVATFLAVSDSVVPS